MDQARMHQELNKGKNNAHPAIPSAVSAIAAVTVAAASALTTPNGAQRLNAANLGQTDVMSAGLIATVVRTKALEPSSPAGTSLVPTRTTQPLRSTAQHPWETRQQQAPTMPRVNRQRVRKAQKHAKNAPVTAMAVIVDPVLTAQSKVIARNGLRVTFSQRRKIQRKNPAAPTLPQVLKHPRQQQYQPPVQ